MDHLYFAEHAGKRFSRRTPVTYTHVLIGRNLTPLHEGQVDNPEWQVIYFLKLPEEAERIEKIRYWWRELVTLPLQERGHEERNVQGVR